MKERYQDGSREFGAGETGSHLTAGPMPGRKDLGAGKGRDSSFGRNGAEQEAAGQPRGSGGSGSGSSRDQAPP